MTPLQIVDSFPCCLCKEDKTFYFPDELWNIVKSFINPKFEIKNIGDEPFISNLYFPIYTTIVTDNTSKNIRRHININIIFIDDDNVITIEKYNKDEVIISPQTFTDLKNKYGLTLLKNGYSFKNSIYDSQDKHFSIIDKKKLNNLFSFGIDKINKIILNSYSNIIRKKNGKIKLTTKDKLIRELYKIKKKYEY